MQVYTALWRPTEVETAATGHQVTICHISKAANKYTPFPGHSPEDFHTIMIIIVTLQIYQIHGICELVAINKFQAIQS